MSLTLCSLSLHTTSTSIAHYFSWGCRKLPIETENPRTVSAASSIISLYFSLSYGARDLRYLAEFPSLRGKRLRFYRLFKNWWLIDTLTTRIDFSCAPPTTQRRFLITTFTLLQSLLSKGRICVVSLPFLNTKFIICICCLLTLSLNEY
jgi:hypothetical protein